MSKNNQALIDLRRMRVASLVLRQVTQREIVELLPRYKIINPETGQPYSLGTINNDIQYLRAEWQLQARDHVESHRARVLAELQEIKREAWGQKDLRVILAALGEEIDLLGLKDVTIRVKTEPEEQVIDFREMEEELLDQFIVNAVTMLEAKSGDRDPGA